MKRGPIEDVDLWPVWDQISCPVLVLRGTESDLLLPATAEEMTRRGPRTEVVEIDGTGHAPALMAKDQIEIVRDWLLG
jgi:pimeloyl-ACP methyl ester carboxylesterase